MTVNVKWVRVFISRTFISSGQLKCPVAAISSWYCRAILKRSTWVKNWERISEKKMQV